MNETTLDQSATPAHQRYLPLMLFLFIGSGCAALVYEIVWFQLLQLVVGVSPVSLGVLLGTFMGGMCLGSFLLPRYIGRGMHPLRVYAYLELGIAVFGILILLVMPLVMYVYSSVGGSSFSLFLRCLVAALCLLPPTLMMGATLPAVARWVETSPKGVSWMGFFYGGNIFGAVTGCLLAGYYLLRYYDVTVATFVAVALNVIVALAGLLIAKLMPYTPAAVSSVPVEKAKGATAVYITIALSGLTALASEVLWTRILSLTFGATTYTFSLILAVFLIGLGIGSSAGATIARDVERPRVALGWCQMLLCGAMAWASYMLTQSLPYWAINPQIVGGAANGQWYMFQLDVVRCFWVVLPGSILWGASFPLALAAVAQRGQDPGRLVGGVYAANTVGAIVGAMCASLLLVWWLGSQVAQQVLIVISVLAGLLMLAPEAAGEPNRKSSFQWASVLLLILATGAAGLLVRSIHGVPGLLIAYGRYSATWVGQSSIIYSGEGLNASVAVTELSSGVRNYHNAGKVQASSEPQDMRLQRMLGHTTTLLSEHPDKVVVIGCGAGVTAGAVSIDPRLKEETIAEIESLVPFTVDEYFGAQNFHVIKNPKVKVHIDDARHFVQTSKEKWDALTSDPLDPWVKGAAALYTQEFFQTVKEKLTDGGLVTLFVQLYESNPEAVKSEIATFFSVFPHGFILANTQAGRGYDLVLVGPKDAMQFDVDKIDARLKSPEYAPVLRSLSEVGISSAIELFANFAGQPRDMGRYLKDAQLNRDRNLRLQYLAGMGLNFYQNDPIYQDIVTDARIFPDNLFTGKPETIEALKQAIRTHQGQ
jgi:spermidine synthase